MYGNTLSKKRANSSGDAPSPYLTPIFIKNSNNYPVHESVTIPLD
jgi:hypothetical protein